MNDQVSISCVVGSAPHKLWEALTVPHLMIEWMAGPEMQLEIVTEWKVGGPVIIKGFHHVKFENRGVVLAFEPERKLSYSHLSSVSNLPDRPENYTVITFVLTPVEGGTLLTLTLKNFPDEIIRKHMELYWKPTLQILQRFAEARA
jgi:uncharacterized protein YndB with AHSA1/START domain